MPHERQAIRDAVIDLIVAANTGAADRVTRSRVAPVRGDQLPAVSVWTSSESVDPDTYSTAPRELRRTLMLAVECWVEVADVDGLDDALDDLALEVETALDQDDSLDGTATSCVLASSEIGVRGDGNKPQGCVRLEYEVVYLTGLRTAVRDAAYDDFDTAQVRTEVDRDMANNDQAVDDLEDIHE